jgi:hypothetical protein
VLREIRSVSQVPGEPLRRWFQCAEMDLFVWSTTPQHYVRFELSYGKPPAEKNLSWSDEEGFRHHRVEDGTRPGHHPAAPLLVEASPASLEPLRARFLTLSEHIDQGVREFILAKLLPHSHLAPLPSANAVVVPPRRYVRRISLVAAIAITVVLAVLLLVIGDG